MAFISQPPKKLMTNLFSSLVRSVRFAAIINCLKTNILVYLDFCFKPIPNNEKFTLILKKKNIYQPPLEQDMKHSQCFKQSLTGLISDFSFS